MEILVNLKKKLKDFSLDIEWHIGNEIAVLFGFSGAGKSMTLQMMAGLFMPDEGHVRIGSVTVFDSSKRINISPQKRKVGYVFQDLALFPHMTVLDNIIYGSANTGKSDRKNRAMEMITAFHLRGLERKIPAELSGGQKQSVAFARALMRKPDILLLDEPFSALDKPLRAEMVQFLKEIKKEFNVPIIFVTHDITEAFFLADIMIVYSKGKVVQIGAPEKIFKNPLNREVQMLIKTDELLNQIKKE